MKKPYQYTVLRYVHDTSTGEFVNVGVVLLAPEERFISAVCRSTYKRISAVFPGLNGEALKRQLRLIQARVAEEGARMMQTPLFAAPSSVIEVAQQILPPDASSLQWSEPGSGVSSDYSRTLEQLFQRLVARYDEKPTQNVRNDDDIWRTFKRPLESRNVLKHLQVKKISAADDEVEFPYAWKNGVWHCLEPLSFDLSAPESIRDKAHKMLGRMVSIQEAKEEFKLYLLLGEPRQPELFPAFERAIGILQKLPGQHELVRESEATAFCDNLAEKMALHSPPHFEHAA